jgi:tubulin-folding cofactor B
MRYDLHQSILSVKENIERRYGSDVKFMQLILKDEKGMLISNLEEDHRTLAFYGAENGNIIYVLDLNPNSIHKEIEDLAKIEKYIISEEDYQKLPYSFRKWKKYLIKTNLGLLDNIQNPLSNAAGENDDYMKGIADCIKDKERCKLMNNGCRGTVMYVGKMSGMGYGYYVGI